jgi:heterodisulfide reductase subunit C
MKILPNLIFITLLTVAASYAIINFSKIRRNILMGKDEDRSDNMGVRIKNMILIAFGQKKMFARPIPAILHLFIYVGFLVVNIEMLEIATDGIFGTHRIFAPILGSFYPYMINIFEFFALAVIISCVSFFIRRNVLKLARFQSTELANFPRRDANTILYIEVVLMLAFLKMNALDQAIQLKGSEHYIQTGSFLISGALSNLYKGFDVSTLIIFERTCWWVHIIGVMLFLNYLPFSKHLHIMLAFPNTYFGNLSVKGHLNNMPEVTNEVKLMLNLPVETTQAPPQPGKFGAKDIQDLSWKNLLDAYSCTECGRCTSVCPANLTGKKLSPRKIMMDTRDRMEEVGRNIDKHGKDFTDNKSLAGDYITHEELLACTTCNACVEACPVNINPLEIIVQLRRFKIMEESAAPASWNGMFSNMETSFAPWKFSPSDRANWRESV